MYKYYTTTPAVCCMAVAFEWLFQGREGQAGSFWRQNPNPISLIIFVEY